MIGYHFTSIENWKKIKKDRKLSTYKIKHADIKKGDEVFEIFEKEKAIYVWINKLKNESKNGTILSQMYSKTSSEIVELKLKLDKEGVWSKNHSQINATHEGSIGKYPFHLKEKSQYYFKDVPIKDIKLIGTYKLKDAWKK